MLGTILAFFTSAAPLLSLASNLLPILAIARSINNPAATSAGLLNVVKAIQFVQPIVAQVEAVSNAGPTKMSGPDKLALLQAILHEGESAMIASGSGGQLAQMMPLLDAAVAAVCAQMKVGVLTSTPIKLTNPVIVAPTAFGLAAAHGTLSANNLQNSA